MGKNGNELLAQTGRFARIDESSLLLCRAFLSIQMKGDQLSEILEHPDDFGPVQPRGSIAQSAPKNAPFGSTIGIEI